jgi:hypothetical protein
MSGVKAPALRLGLSAVRSKVFLCYNEDVTKAKNPLWSLSAHGKLGDVILRRRGKQVVAEKPPVLKDQRSPGQLSWRHMYQKAIALWNALGSAEKQEWESLARPKHMAGMAWFISQALKPNPGLYLPLQGGIMQGDINMSTHAITSLPDPTANQDADTKAARNTAIATHKADASAHHIKYTDAEALAAAIAGGLSKLVWRDSSAQSLNLLSITADTGWNDLDLTAHTSALAKFAILRVRITLISYTAGDVYATLRKNGTAPTYTFVLPAVSTYFRNYMPVNAIIALDEYQVLEYRVNITNTAEVDFQIVTLGYIE